jgi:hypothetical protein
LRQRAKVRRIEQDHEAVTRGLEEAVEDVDQERALQLSSRLNQLTGEKVNTSRDLRCLMRVLAFSEDQSNLHEKHPVAVANPVTANAEAGDADSDNATGDQSPDAGKERTESAVDIQTMISASTDTHCSTAYQETRPDGGQSARYA